MIPNNIPPYPFQITYKALLDVSETLPAVSETLPTAFKAIPHSSEVLYEKCPFLSPSLMIVIIPYRTKVQKQSNE